MTAPNDTTEQVDRPLATVPSSGPGTTTQAMKDAVKRPTAFDRFADWVSEAMGRPLNIAFWFILIVAWTLIFALGGPNLSSGSWLPSWFTSQGYNFPLNLITTVAELFIGFLVATAANRGPERADCAPRQDRPAGAANRSDRSQDRLVDRGKLGDHQRHPRAHDPGGQGHRPHQRGAQARQRSDWALRVGRRRLPTRPVTTAGNLCGIGARCPTRC